MKNIFAGAKAPATRFIVVIVCLMHFGLAKSVQAISPADWQAKLAARVDKLVSPHGDKVGLAFIDLESAWQYSYNFSREYPAASVAKVPVMACAFTLADKGELNLGQNVLCKRADRLGGAGVLQWLKGNRYYTLRNLIRLMIVLSDNTATNLVVRTIGIEPIRMYLDGISLRSTRVIDPTMLVEPPNTNNNLTTPSDMAQMMLLIYRGTGFSPAAQKEMLGYLKTQRYRYGIWRGVAKGTVVADKTGNLEGILNDVGIVYTKEGNYIISIFTCGFTKQRSARLMINDLSQAVFEEYTGTKVIQPKPKLKKKIKKRRAPRRRKLSTKV